MLYYGLQNERDELIKQIRKPQGPLKMFPVVITSFEIAMIDRKKLQVLLVSYSYFEAAVVIYKDC